jgi:hypothetical protein
MQNNCSRNNVALPRRVLPQIDSILATWQSGPAQSDVWWTSPKCIQLYYQRNHTVADPHHSLYPYLQMVPHSAGWSFKIEETVRNLATRRCSPAFLTLHQHKQYVTPHTFRFKWEESNVAEQHYSANKGQTVCQHKERSIHGAVTTRLFVTKSYREMVLVW